jgi:peptide deformylase
MKTLNDPEVVLQKSPIVKYGSRVLREVCEDIVFPDPTVRSMMASMLLVMHESGGIGLAANQVGINKRVAVVDFIGSDDKKAEQLLLINPKIVESSGEIEIVEGCLSIPGLSLPVKRAEKIKVENYDIEGNKTVFEADGMLARAIQHEIDHLDGKMYVDRLTTVERMLIDNKLKQIARLSKKDSRS